MKPQILKPTASSVTSVPYSSSSSTASTPAPSNWLRAELIFPALGVVLSNALYFSPLPAVRNAIATEKLGALNVLPQAMMVLATFAWLCYGFSCPNYFIVSANLPGFVVAIYYVKGTFRLIPSDRPQDRQLVLSVLAVGLGAIASLLLAVYLFGVKHATRSFVLGTYASCICVALFASPLSTMRQVVREGNASSIQALLTATQCTNCLMWTIYGWFMADDVWVWGPNGTGLVLGVIQLLLKLVYPSSRAEYSNLKEGDDLVIEGEA